VSNAALPKGVEHRILVAEDDYVSRRTLEARLRGWGDEVVVAGDGQAAWEILQRDDAPGLAILDWMMPRMDGLEVCRLVRGRTGRPYTYLVLLTARDRAADQVVGLEAGADDYLTKPVSTAELRARLQTGRRILRLQHELLETQRRLHEQATHDALTGLRNRGAVLEILRHELAARRRDGTPLSALMADLDHFKRINDTLGHLAGDTVLREAARRMRSALRKSDGIGRYGGEEFLVVLPQCDFASAVQIAERLSGAVSCEPVFVDGTAVRLTLSVGLTTVTDEAGGAGADVRDETTWTLYVVDAALYRAKQSGRNRIESGEWAPAVARTNFPPPLATGRLGAGDAGFGAGQAADG
jgi:diguanylate cyclase (GGDEF)-like protein